MSSNDKLKVMLLEMCFIDFDDLGEEEVKAMLDDLRLPNHVVEEGRSLSYRNLRHAAAEHVLDETKTAAALEPRP